MLVFLDQLVKSCLAPGAHFIFYHFSLRSLKTSKKTVQSLRSAQNWPRRWTYDVRLCWFDLFSIISVKSSLNKKRRSIPYLTFPFSEDSSHFNILLLKLITAPAAAVVIMCRVSRTRNLLSGKPDCCPGNPTRKVSWAGSVVWGFEFFSSAAALNFEVQGVWQNTSRPPAAALGKAHAAEGREDYP